MIRSMFFTAAFLASMQVAHALEPIPGSITYSGNNRPLEKAPVGSLLSHQFISGGETYSETYRVKDDRHLELVRRERRGSR